MNQWGKTAAEEMLGLLRDKFGTDFSDIAAVKQYWHSVNVIFFSHLNHRLLYGNRPFCLAVFEHYGLVSEELVLFERENHQAVQSLLCRTSDIRPGSPAEVAAIRQQMLCIELNIRKDCIAIQSGKAERNNTGSYYTPAELAEEMVRSVLATPAGTALVNRGGPLRIADLSCGGGDFFRSAQTVLWEQYQIPRAVSCEYFWGVDIDPIALQISICGLLVHTTEARWPEIISHFHLGNPLLQVSQEQTNTRKGELFAMGRLYAPEMGLCFDWVPEGGFDLVLGNPPWEKIRLEERKFFSALCPEIAGISLKTKRAKKIEELQASWPELHSWYQELSADYAQMSSARFHHSQIIHAVIGELNTYALFTELSYNLTSREGVVSLIIKSTLATAPAHKRIWTFLMNAGAINSLALFQNKEHIFAIDTRERFAVLTLNHQNNSFFYLAAGLSKPGDLCTTRYLSVTAETVATLNPASQMLPNVADTEEINVLLTAHRRLPVFGEVYPDCHFGRLIHLTAHADQIDQQPTAGNVPIYEGKFIERYDARFSTFAGVPEEKKYSGKSSARKIEGILGERPLPESRYFVHEELWHIYLAQYSRPYSLCWRSLTSPTNARTTLAMILPTRPTCQSIQLLQTQDDVQLLMLLGLFNSLPFDYFVRMKMPGLDLTQSVIRQIPVPPLPAYERLFLFQGRDLPLKTHILSCVCARLAQEPLLRPLLDHIPEHVYSLSGNTDSQLEQMLDLLFARAYEMDDTQFSKVREAFPQYRRS